MDREDGGANREVLDQSLHPRVRATIHRSEGTKTDSQAQTFSGLITQDSQAAYDFIQARNPAGRDET